MIKLKRKKIKITTNYSKKVAMRFHKKEYYHAMAEDIKLLPKMEGEKKKYRLRKSKLVSGLFKKFKGENYEAPWKILLGIFKKRQKSVNGLRPHSKVTQLMSILTNPTFLSVCYNNIKRKRGAMTPAQATPLSQQTKMAPNAKALLKRTRFSPDGTSKSIFMMTAQLLKEGRYPWGISRRVWIPKPGTKDVLRPITIPPFMDKVIQEGIRRILESIYEPKFEKMNRSFGFRANKGVHDAIHGIARKENWGLNIAIEGDIKSAYDKVNRDKLISILKEEIADKKFINLIENRLNYTYYDTESKQYIKEQEGIPQGGIDSPYLWNIYMLKFDDFILKYMAKLCVEKDFKLRTGNFQRGKRSNELLKTSKNRSFTKSYEDYRVKKRAIKKRVVKLNKEIEINEREWKNILKEIDKDKNTEYTRETAKEAKYDLIKKSRILRHKRNKAATTVPKRNGVKFHYTRYADDWILLGNYGTATAIKIKSDIKDFLEQELHATLSLEKTLITNIRKKPASFLGFQIYIRDTYKINKVEKANKSGKSKVIQRDNNIRIIVRPDIQRLINRMYIKNFCNKKGVPTSIPWLSNLATYAIIERYNACIRGLANFYAEWVTYPSTLSRWLYILKYSCLKTLAQKYSCTITKIFKRFGVKTSTQDTVEFDVSLNFPVKGRMTKTYRLITAKEAVTRALSLKRTEVIKEIYDAIEYNRYLDNYVYQTPSGKQPRVMDQDFLEKINWVTRRAVASLHMPCTLCGETEGVEMHHIRHIRKTPYKKLNRRKYWLPLMSLRNRKQIPVCFNCHRCVIHGGKYTGPKLKHMSPKFVDTEKGLHVTFYDGRQINLENYIKPGSYYKSKTLEEKGWKPTKNYFVDSTLEEKGWKSLKDEYNFT